MRGHLGAPGATETNMIQIPSFIASHQLEWEGGGDAVSLYTTLAATLEDVSMLSLCILSDRNISFQIFFDII